MAHQLAFAHSKHARVGQDRGAHFLYTLVDVEKYDEKYKRHAERNLRPDAEAKPERKNRRQHNAWQRIDHLDVRIEYRSDARLPRKPEADQHPGNRTKYECEN